MLLPPTSLPVRGQVLLLAHPHSATIPACPAPCASSSPAPSTTSPRVATAVSRSTATTRTGPRTWKSSLRRWTGSMLRCWPIGGIGVKSCLLPSARLRSTMNHVSSLAHRIPPVPFITSPPAVTAVSRFTSTRAGRTRAQRAARSPARAAAVADASVSQEDEASRLEAVPRRLRRQPRRGAAAWRPRARHDDDGVGAGRGLVGFAREPGDCGGGGRRARLTESPGESGARNARSSSGQAVLPVIPFVDGKDRDRHQRSRRGSAVAPRGVLCADSACGHGCL